MCPINIYHMSNVEKKAFWKINWFCICLPWKRKIVKKADLFKELNIKWKQTSLDLTHNQYHWLEQQWNISKHWTYTDVYVKLQRKKSIFHWLCFSLSCSLLRFNSFQSVCYHTLLPSIQYICMFNIKNDILFIAVIADRKRQHTHTYKPRQTHKVFKNLV